MLGNQLAQGKVGPTQLHAPANQMIVKGTDWVPNERVAIIVTASIPGEGVRTLKAVTAVTSEGKIEFKIERPKDFPVHVSFGATACVNYARFDEPLPGGIQKDLLQYKFTA